MALGLGGSSSIGKQMMITLRRGKLGEKLICMWMGASDRLRSSLLLGRHTLEVDLNDVLIYNEELGQILMERPGECIPLVSINRPWLPPSLQLIH